MKKLIKFAFAFAIAININQVFAQEIVMQDVPDITSKSHILIDQDTGMILEGKDIDEQVYPASTTKILTAIIAIELLELTDMVTVTKEAYADMNSSSSTANLKVGEEMSVHDLLYCLMLPSANEAANALALHISGNIEDFCKLMNLKAVQLGAYNSNFANPSGLHLDNHYSTARDMSILTVHAMKNEFFYTVVNTAQKSLEPTNLTPNGSKVFTSNMLIYRTSDPRYYAYANGVKTGFTTPAGACLVAQAEKDDKKLISVIFGGDRILDPYENTTVEDTKTLFEWGFSNFKKEQLLETSQPMTEIAVKLSAKSDYVSLIAKKDLIGIVPIDFKEENIVIEYNLAESVNAPIKTNQKIGSVNVSYDGVSYGNVDLIALNDVEMSTALYYVDKLENFFSSSTFKIILIAVAIMFVLSILSINIKNRRKMKKSRNKKSRSRSRYR